MLSRSVSQGHSRLCCHGWHQCFTNTFSLNLCENRVLVSKKCFKTLCMPLLFLCHDAWTFCENCNVFIFLCVLSQCRVNIVFSGDLCWYPWGHRWIWPPQLFQRVWACPQHHRVIQRHRQGFVHVMVSFSPILSLFRKLQYGSVIMTFVQITHTSLGSDGRVRI